MTPSKQKGRDGGNRAALKITHYASNISRRLIFRQAQVAAAFLLLASTSGIAAPLLLADFIDWLAT